MEGEEVFSSNKRSDISVYKTSRDLEDGFRASFSLPFLFQASNLNLFGAMAHLGADVAPAACAFFHALSEVIGMTMTGTRPGCAAGRDLGGGAAQPYAAWRQLGTDFNVCKLLQVGVVQASKAGSRAVSVAGYRAWQFGVERGRCILLPFCLHLRPRGDWLACGLGSVAGSTV